VVITTPVIPEPSKPTDSTLPTDPAPTEPPPQDPNWSWSVWEENGMPVSVCFSGTAIAPVDFDAIAAGATLYNLTGSGVSGAIVREGGYSALVQGTCGLGVQIGNKVTPSWNGSFAMANGSDSLNFTASGFFQAGNTLSLDGSPISYTMVVKGTTYDNSQPAQPGDPLPITSSTFSGALVGPGTGPTPITGVFGSFFFDHGGYASAQGGFGSDLK